MDEIYATVNAKIKFETIATLRVNTKEIRKLKKDHELTFVELEDGIQVSGSLSAINALNEFLLLQKPDDPPEQLIIRSAKAQDKESARNFFDGEIWNFSTKDDRTVASSNVSLDPGKFCYLLLDKSSQLKEILRSNRASMRVKDFNGKKLRIKIDETKAGVKHVKTQLEKMCDVSTTGLYSTEYTIEHLSHPQFLCHQIEKSVEPHLIFLRRNIDETWDMSVLVLESQQEKAEECIHELIEEMSANSSDARSILIGLCDRKMTLGRDEVTRSLEHLSLNHDNGAVGGEESAAVSLPPNALRSRDRVMPNGETTIASENATEFRTLGEVGSKNFEMLNGETEAGSGSGLTKLAAHYPGGCSSKELMIEDDDVIDYMFKFHVYDLQKIEQDCCVEIKIKDKSKGILELKQKPVLFQKADLQVTHLAQDIYQHKRREIDVSSVNPVTYGEKSEKAKQEAHQMRFLVRPNVTQWSIFGPESRIDECVAKIKICFGIMLARRRRMVSNSMVARGTRDGAFESLGSNTPSLTGSEHLPMTAGKPERKVYHNAMSEILVYAWVTDITKLKVDVVVNAANERLQHDAGVALAIARAAGRQLETECRKYIGNYGKLPISGVCSTAAGNMPCKRVFHTVGPMWHSYTDKSQCNDKLYTAFLNCLETGHRNKYVSIAFPAISSGIYGVPNTIVSEMAVNAIIAFCHRYPYSQLKFIHLVDIVEKNVLSFQQQLQNQIGPGVFTDISSKKSAADFDGWVAGSSRSNASSTSPGLNPMNQSRFGNSNYSNTSSNRASQSLVPQQQVRGRGRGASSVDTSPGGYGEKSKPGRAKSVDANVGENDTDMDWETVNADDTPNNYISSAKGTDVDEAISQSLTTSKPAPGGTYAQVVSRQELPKVHVQAGKKITSIDNDAKRVATGIKEEKKEEKKEGEDKEKEETCSICMDTPRNPKTLDKCKHTFCKECIDNCFDKMQPKCPNCGVVYGEIKGTQPDDGTMKYTKSSRSLAGYEGCGSITIDYYFPHGVQTDKHPNPGKRYYGTSRTAYLPDNSEGQRVLGLLQRAFKARVVFTIGRSSTTGVENCVIWNCIHHKTNRVGGPQSYGYPDPTYLSRVQEELAAQGFK